MPNRQFQIIGTDSPVIQQYLAANGKPWNTAAGGVAGATDCVGKPWLCVGDGARTLWVSRWMMMQEH